jgi:hypothetical protein
MRTDLSTAGYQPITPVSPYYFFTPRQTQNLQAYQSWPSVHRDFPRQQRRHRDRTG